MIDERKAALIRGIFAFCLILAAIAAALFIDLPGLGPDKESGKEWRPPVSGMKRDQNESPVEIRPPEKPMEKTNR